MPFQIRRLGAADKTEAITLGREAFGFPVGPRHGDAQRRPWPPPGTTEWGTFDGATLAAKAARRAYRSHFGGALVPTCGLAGVTVAAEYRGRGLLSPLLAQVLEHAHGEGDVISTLFASAPGIYRRFGFELIASQDTVEIASTVAAEVRPGTPLVRTRRATAADFDAVFKVYTQWASKQNGPLTRTGPCFPAVDLTEEFTGVTLAVGPDGQVLGYASWDRGSGDGSDAVLNVVEILALAPEAYRALWRTLGSFSAVVARIRLRTSGADVARLFLPPRQWRTTSVNPYMLRVDDVAAAFSVREVPVRRETIFAVAGDGLGSMDGTYRLRPPGEADDDAPACSRIGAVGDGPPDAPVYTPGGLALAWSGAQSSANIRMAGGLSGGDAATDAVLDQALGGWPVHIRDDF
ncbi:GNAT family N-acetyltransferase [Pseudactinotalea sp. Z1748]|uniref:GNAT family N-acetyltransferase n=1 Tax=Pseudactinotalea sp. Z1748 TaxID=3413027 RepID=UPI003C7C0DFF